MSKVEIQFLDQGFHRALFDAMPVPVFVVDEDVNILDCNEAAGQVMGKVKRRIVGRRGGEVLHCVHSKQVPEGCGRAPACSHCVVRKSVGAAARGHRVSRRLAKMKVIVNGKATKVDLRVSCQPFTYRLRSYILLVLEGLNS